MKKINKTTKIKEVDISWLLKGKKPTKRNLQSLKSFAKTNLKNMVIKGAHSEDIKAYMKTIDKIDKIDNKKKLTKKQRQNLSKVFAGKKVHIQNGGRIVIRKVTMRSTKITKNKMKIYLNDYQLKKMEKILKSKAFAQRVKRKTKDFVKQTKREYETQTNSKITMIEARRLALEDTLIDYNTSEDYSYDLEEEALANDIIGPIIEAMGGWYRASTKYAEDLERLINDYL